MYRSHVVEVERYQIDTLVNPDATVLHADWPVLKWKGGIRETGGRKINLAAPSGAS